MFGVGVRAVSSQHGTGVEGRSHPCTQGYYPKEGLFIFALITTDVLIIHVYTANMFFYAIHIFILCRLKTMEMRNMHLFLDPTLVVITKFFL
jgi:hypothetical protein